MSSLSPKGEVRVLEPTAAERTVARRAAESRATVPHLELSTVWSGRELVSTARLIQACAQALVEHPRVNAGYRDGRFELYSRINVGLVLALPEAYLIPTVFDADAQEAEALERAVELLQRQAQSGQLTAATFSGATFTVWNASELGIAQASLPVVPPQAAILSAGTTALTLTCDHRILYGAQAAAFLTSVNRRLGQDEG